MSECGYCGGRDGEHQGDCLVLRSARPGLEDRHELAEAGPEDIIGPSGRTLWSITVASARAGEVTFEDFHVRAATYDGAIILARELRLDDTEDIEALEVECI